MLKREITDTMSRQAIPAYVINLDRRPDRWQTISEHLDDLGIAHERIPAVDARLLARQEEWERQTNGNPPIRKIDTGAAALLFGHRKVMEILLNSQHPAALILEDDAELASDTAMLLESADWWPAGAKIVQLEEHQKTGGKWGGATALWRASGNTPSGREVRKLEWRGSCTAAYLINREGARIAMAAFDKVLYGIDPLLINVDQALFNMRLSKTARKLGPVQVVPAMARQRGAGKDSDLFGGRQEAERREKRRRMLSLKRNLGSIPYKILVRCLMATGKVEKAPVRYEESP